MTAGYQGSERSGCELIIYPQQGDSVNINSEPLQFTGRSADDGRPAIISCQTNKALGAAAGGWSATCKEAGNRQLFERLTDDDWVDIVFTRHARRFHTMRGLLTDVRRSVVADSGATVVSWTLTGKDFGRIWEVTPIWFNPMTEDDVCGATAMRVFSSYTGEVGAPPKMVEGFLRGMLEELGNKGRANWILPSGIPVEGATNVWARHFVKALTFDARGFPALPALVSAGFNYLMSQGTLWSLATEWSDSPFTELWADTLPLKNGGPQWTVDGELRPENAHMVVNFREKPFPTTDKGADSLWFRLPLFSVPRQAVAQSDVGCGGHERYNAFFTSPLFVTELLKDYGMTLRMPVWDKEDILRHGMRRFDVSSKYWPQSAGLANYIEAQRRKVVDWYCLNPYLLNGTVALGYGRPDIRVGCRLRVTDDRGPQNDETYYVEQVTNTYQPGKGLRTSLGVTRGWRGTDHSLRTTLTVFSDKYVDGSPITLPNATTNEPLLEGL